ncbi:MAG: TetR/AcrR family transcriptional regulator [Candidatus Cybelea sp.]
MQPQVAEGAHSGRLILKAAEAVFAQKGYDAATFTDICREAGVSRGLPSYLFGSKEALYREVVGRAAERLRAEMIEPLRKCVPSASAEQAVTVMVDTYIDYLEANPRIVRLLQWEMLSDSAEPRPFAPSSALFAEVLTLLESIFAKEGFGAAAARAVLGSVVALCFLPAMVGARIAGLGEIPPAQRKAHIIHLLNEGLHGDA